jgi:hypothetical protein
VDIEAVPDGFAVAGLGRHCGAALFAVGKDILQKWAVSIRALPVSTWVFPVSILRTKRKEGDILRERHLGLGLGLGVGPQKSKRGGGRTLKVGFGFRVRSHHLIGGSIPCKKYAALTSTVLRAIRSLFINSWMARLVRLR